MNLLKTLFAGHQSQIYGSARYMGFFEKKRFLANRNKGFLIGDRQRLSEKHSFQNLLLVAPTGMGKTTRFIIPNILKSNASMVVTDPSGEIFQKTSGYLQRKGYDIQVFQPARPEGSIKINHLKPFSESQQKIKQIATILAQHSGGQNDKFWTTQATNILYLVLSAQVASGDQSLNNLANARLLLNNFGADGKGIEDFMLKHLNDTLFSEYKAFVSQHSTVLQDSVSTARTALDLWSDPDICRLTSGHTLDLHGFRKRKTILYLIVPEHQVGYFSLLLNLTYSALFNACIENGSDPEGLPVYFLMDEFANCGQILNFAQIITVSRKRKMPISIILQDLAQLEAVYGKANAQIIYGGGCANKLFYAGLDINDCQKLERTLGTKTEIDFNESLDRKVSAPLRRAFDIRMLSDDEYLLISSNKPPIRGKARGFYRNWGMRRRSKVKMT